MPDARIERGRATRRDLIDAARRRFGEQGYEGTPIEMILDDAGVARGALYHHFRSKQVLFDAVLEQVVIDIAAAAANAARPVNDPVASLQAGCDAWLHLALDPAVQRIALLDAPSVVGWTRWRDLDEQHTLGGIKAGFRRISATGAPLGADLDILAHVLLAAVNEVALMIARAEDPTAQLSAGRAAVAALIQGIIAPRST
jgi:AcrR family transcriptional regulator